MEPTSSPNEYGFGQPLNPEHPVSECAPALIELFQRQGLTAAGLAGHLGPAATNALYRGVPAAVRHALGTADIDVLIRAFLLHDAVPRSCFERAVGTSLTQVLIDARVATTTDTGAVRVVVDIRPHTIDGRDRWVFSDVDASLVDHVPGRDHVLGVGAASLSLLRSTPTTPVESVLDLGTGSGVQLLGQLGSAASVTGTDIHPRALDFARATVAGATVAGATVAGATTADGAADDTPGPQVELLTGPWFEPVSGRTFDRVTANPPFVVGPPEVDHIYRDSGLALDGATQKVASEVVDYLAPHGTAHLLGAWVHTAEGGSWRQRVASWLPSTGVTAWVMQRDVADPAHYVATWLEDESLDPRSAAGQERTARWLQYFADNDVTGIGFGFIAIQRIGDDEPSDILAEEMEQPFHGSLGPEVEEYFARAEWLRGKDRNDLSDCQFLVRPSAALEQVSLPDAESRQGFAPAVWRLTRTDGPRWSHDIDKHLASLLAGLNPQGLGLGETAELYAFAQGLDAEELVDSAVSAAVDLIRHGFLIPTDLL